SFNVYDAELMHPVLAAKFPELRTFVGKGIDDPTADLRIAYSPYTGFSGSILSGKHTTVYIDPYTQDLENYVVYYRKDLKKNASSPAFECKTAHNEIGKYSTEAENSAAFTGDCNLRRYRLAQSSNGEYSQYHIGQAGGTTGDDTNDKAIVQAAMNVTMIRVNGVYERDLGITMQFVPNNDLIIYLNAGTDPWAGEYNNTTQTTIDNVIGNANYDIGHNFNTSGGGSAGCIGCICTTGSKGSGYTGLPAPIGDPFDIDYVAHEMGHQFGGFHTQASSSCRSGSGQTEVEPGSGSTIMGYAGICNANVQNQSDDYFHYVNIRDIVQNINSGVSSSCAELITSGNGSPVADAGFDYSIPTSTPFILEGVGSDPDDSGLTYCWEQNDPESAGSAGPPSTTRTQGPQFRSLDPVTVPVRYMPNLPDVIAGNNPTWEVLNSVSRNMEFAFTVRDNNNVSGCTESDLMSVSVVGTAGPFIVNAPNGGETLFTGNNATVTWDVANTDAAPISASTVDVFLSTDGGLTYPFTVATGVANTGTANLIVPNQISTTCRM
ncbi:MAG: reprolysin-like metallopeptidase, partial [Saprospiraceae bacterium]